MGEYLAEMGVPSFAISETQKFGHVTYFGMETGGYINEEIETTLRSPQITSQ